MTCNTEPKPNGLLPCQYCPTRFYGWNQVCAACRDSDICGRVAVRLAYEASRRVFAHVGIRP